jgi:hypothetical protein
MTGTTRRWLVTAPVLAALIAVTACTSNSPKKEDKPVQAKPEAEVVSLAQSYAQNAATSVGSTVQNWQTASAPCAGGGGEVATDGRWSLTAGANIPLPKDQHATTLQKLRDQWQQQGYEIKDFRTIPPDNQEAVLSARNPADGISITLSSAGTGTALAVVLGSPCYKPAPGEDPANQP